MTMTLEEKFIKFDNENPKVYEMFVHFASELIDKGYKNLSTSLITERIRWEVKLFTVSDDQFKINNNHRAFYARKFMEDFPEYNGYFRIREQRS
jgi:aspartyl aminopeptidase